MQARSVVTKILALFRRKPTDDAAIAASRAAIVRLESQGRILEPAHLYLLADAERDDKQASWEQGVVAPWFEDIGCRRGFRQQEMSLIFRWFNVHLDNGSRS